MNQGMRAVHCESSRSSPQTSERACGENAHRLQSLGAPETKFKVTHDRSLDVELLALLGGKDGREPTVTEFCQFSHDVEPVFKSALGAIQEAAEWRSFYKLF